MAELVPWLDRFRRGEIDLILGSASNPRKAVLSQLGVPFTVRVSSFPEDLEKELFRDDYSEYPLATSREKTKNILAQLGIVPKPTVLITCDTVVLKDKQHIIEKPEDEEHAKTLLRSLSGTEHQVVTGVVVTLRTIEGDLSEEFRSVTHVKFRELSEDIISAYVASGEPFNKAGGYGIQGLGELLVEELKGSFTNVVGIPLCDVSHVVAALLGRYFK
jgi:septum formation protein